MLNLLDYVRAMMEVGIPEQSSRNWIAGNHVECFRPTGVLVLKAFLVLVAAVSLLSPAWSSPYGHPSPPPPVHQPPPMPPQPPVQPPVRPPSHVQDRMIQQRAVQDAQRATLKAGAMDLPPRSQVAAKKVNSWADIANLSESELAALFKEWGLLPSGGGQVTGTQLKSLWVGEARASGVPQAQINQMLKQVGGAWSQMAGQINGLIGAAGDPNAAMGSLFKQEYAKTCRCGPQAFADALGRAETRLGGQVQDAIMKAMGGQGIPIGSMPSAPLVTYSTNDQPVLVAQAIINQGQAQSSAKAPPVSPVTPPPGPAPVAPPPAPVAVAPPPGPAPVAPPPAPVAVAPPPGPAPIAPPPTPVAVAPPPGPAPVAPPPAPVAVAPPPGPAPVAPPPAPVAVAPPPGPAPVAPPPAPVAVAPPPGPAVVGSVPPAPSTPPTPSLLDLTPPPPSDLSSLTPPPPGPDMTPAEKSKPGDKMPDVPYIPPVVEPEKQCTTVACYQAELDRLARERKKLDIDVRNEPFIATLDTIGNLTPGVGSSGCATANPACALLPIGIAVKGLKALITAGKEAQKAGVDGASQGERAGVFFGTAGMEIGTEAGKELVGGAIGKLVPSGLVDDFGGAVIDVGIGTGVDNAGAIGNAALNFVEGNPGQIAKDTSAFAGDIGRVMTGGGF